MSRLPTLCPDLERITLNHLPRDPIITETVSEMPLAYNRDVLQWFCVVSPLTGEARHVAYRLPRLSIMWAIQDPTSLPAVALPTLTEIDVECGRDLDWLQGSHGATFEKLETVGFYSNSDPIGDPLGTFASAHTHHIRPQCDLSVQVSYFTLVEPKLLHSPFVQPARNTRDTALPRRWLLFWGGWRYDGAPGAGDVKVGRSFN